MKKVGFLRMSWMVLRGKVSHEESRKWIKERQKEKEKKRAERERRREDIENNFELVRLAFQVAPVDMYLAATLVIGAYLFVTFETISKIIEAFIAILKAI